MKDEYFTIGAVLKSAGDAICYGLTPPIKISMHSDVKSIYESEIVDFFDDEIVMSVINHCDIVTDNSLPNDAVFSDVPVQ